jgi:hypothetical protein
MHWYDTVSHTTLHEKCTTWKLHENYIYDVSYLCTTWFYYFITNIEVPSKVHEMKITYITHILQQWRVLHTIYIRLLLFTSVVENDLIVMCGQPTCSISTRMFVQGHPPGLLLVLYRLWDQNQDGMSVGVNQTRARQSNLHASEDAARR